MNKRVCVYCSSSDKIDQVYREAAESFAEAASLIGISVVCGGSRKGLMGVITDTILERGGIVEGVMPNFMKELELEHKTLTNIRYVSSMSERKDLLREDTDAIVVFPGGIGTLEEFLETFTLRRLGKYEGEVILLNIAGFFDPLIALFDHLVDKKVLAGNYRDGLIVVENVKELLKKIEQSQRHFLEPKHYSPS